MKNRGFNLPQSFVKAARNTVASAIPHMSIASRIDHQVLEHVAKCVMVDTIGISLDCVGSTSLPQRYTRLDGDNLPVSDSEWGKGALTSAAGKQSIRVRATRSKAKVDKELLPVVCLTAEGSPAGHRQGHNMVSSADVTALTFDMLRAINARYRFELPFHRRLAIARGLDVEVTRIDPGCMVPCPSGVPKSAVINGLALAGIAAGRNISLYHDETVYIDQSSQTNSTKLYDKLKEIASKRGAFIPDSPNWSILLDLMRDTIRLETVFRKKFFQNHAAFKGLPIHPLLFTPEMLASMVIDELSGFNLKASLRGFLKEEELYAVPLPYRTTLALFQHGRNVRKFLGSERTYQNHRRFLGTNYGVDLEGDLPGEISFPIELGDILDPRRFIPVPEIIANDPNLFFREDLTPTIASLRTVVPSGIGSIFVDPYRN